MISISRISAAQTIAIRHEVLRAGLPVESCHWSEDERPTTFHLGGFTEGRHVGVCTFQSEAFPGKDGPAFRLRGMAVLPDYRSKGVGTLMLLTGENMLRRAGIPLVWCHARIGALPFYEKHGWERIGGMFDIPGAGPHCLMRKDLTAPFGCAAHEASSHPAS